jgi:uncharacterized protein
MNENIEDIRRHAESGDPEAQFQFAIYSLSNLDYEAGIRWLKIASENKHVFASTNLAICYYFGDHVVQSYEKAWPLLQFSAEQGDLSAKYYIALSYLNGHGIAQDTCRAFKILLHCACEGMTFAQLLLADCYSNGVGTKIDLFEAVNWYSRAAFQGLEEAGEKFNKIYYSNHFTDIDGKQRWFWFEKEFLDNPDKLGGLILRRIEIKEGQIVLFSEDNSPIQTVSKCALDEGISPVSKVLH